MNSLRSTNHLLELSAGIRYFYDELARSNVSHYICKGEAAVMQQLQCTQLLEVVSLSIFVSLMDECLLCDLWTGLCHCQQPQLHCCGRCLV